MDYVIELQTVFFSSKLRFMRKFWIQSRFCAILGDRDIWQTKWCYEAENPYSYWLAVAVAASDITGHHNWSWRGTWMTPIAPNKHSQKKNEIVYHIDIF